tara:strand:+ start:297 stop:455 length:159 start_codon:yes stop_codon:yes gene_type:complete
MKNNRQKKSKNQKKEIHLFLLVTISYERVDYYIEISAIGLPGSDTDFQRFTV